MTRPADDPRFNDLPKESRVRERIQQAERGHELRPGALCPHCGGHAFRRQEIKAGSPCPKCDKAPRLAA
jgi:predicted Zn-ribbon and HTH transcriptional regulator